jgi:hypothetical protein
MMAVEAPMDVDQPAWPQGTALVTPGTTREIAQIVEEFAKSLIPNWQVICDLLESIDPWLFIHPADHEAALRAYACSLNRWRPHRKVCWRRLNRLERYAAGWAWLTDSAGRFHA